MGRWSWGAVEVTRVADPDFSLVLPQDAHTRATLERAGWLWPSYVTDDLALQVGSSAIVVRTPSAVVLIDPWLAFDDPAKLAPRLAALRAAGVDPAQVDLVINSHADGIGANVGADGSPTFVNARYLLPQAELDDLRAGVHPEQLGERFPGEHPFVSLDAFGCLHGLAGEERLVPGVHVEDAPGHNRGHVVVWITSGGEQAVVTGHLFLHPAQIASPDSVQGDLDPITLAATRRRLLDRCVADDVLLLGPLFAAPGGGKVRSDDRSWWLEPA